VFGFFGVTDLRFVRAEGIAMGPEAKARAIAAAELEITAVVGVAANADRAGLAA
jgi:FMN-dependent NADH-azoreductase